ncbi:hypothetical protein [Nocardiopsis sp. CC223A]|uniref:hypothetical protein n=1 Tax=Nocardiopsis sp. CC223A TaxID=3044051 RepID=UPI00278BD5F3|nr:hypothetical protein [Nocardiopsis sp. CC223A]
MRRTVQTFTLERMFAEQDADVLVANAGDDARDVLVDAWILVEDGEEWRVETDPGEWSPDLSEGLGGPGPLITQVYDGLYHFMRTNTVTWCGSEVSGIDFVSAYPGRDGESFETLEEYEEDIAEYVDCGSGRADGS